MQPIEVSSHFVLKKIGVTRTTGGKLQHSVSALLKQRMLRGMHEQWFTLKGIPVL